MDEKDLYWLAGLLEGEGSFCKGPPSRPNSCFISIGSTDRDIVEKVALLFNVSVQEEKRRKNARPHWKDVFTVRVRGLNAVNIMKQLRPLMGVRRKQQIDIAIECYRPKILRTDKMVINKVKIMLKTGLSNRKIASHLNICRDTVGRVKKLL